jgi:hypothetical protein
MTKNQIFVGRIYRMKVSGVVVPVRVDSIEERAKGYIYHCTNTITKRECKAHSAAKFRGEIK